MNIFKKTYNSIKKKYKNRNNSSQDKYKEKTEPFAFSDLEQMIGQEFHCLVETAEENKKINERLGKNIFNTDTPYSGMISEVIDRKPHSINFYTIGNIKDIVMDESVLFDSERSHDTILFTLDSYVIENPTYVVLIGSAREYDMHDNIVGDCSYNIKIEVENTEGTKTKLSLMCL
jgi:hypothetical protein